jgi:hypothetical protein
MRLRPAGTETRAPTPGIRCPTRIAFPPWRSKTLLAPSRSDTKNEPGAFEPLDDAPQTSLPDPEADRVQDERSRHPGRRRRDQDGEEREASVPDQKPYKRQGQFRRYRHEQASRQDENEHADVPERVDYVEDPPHDIGEQTTHQALSAYLLRETI